MLNLAMRTAQDKTSKPRNVRPHATEVVSESHAPPSDELSLGLRRYLFSTVCLSGAAVLIVEILGAKMLAPYVGTSHFVWTAQIAVTLLSLAFGYALGGRIADRAPQLRVLYAALMVAGIWLCGAAWACEPIAFACLRFRLALGSLLASAALFFVPLALMAMVGPLVVRRLTSSVSTLGQSVGTLSAMSTAGSVGGTVLIAYVLIPFLANSSIIYLTASYLVLLGAGYFLIWSRQGKAVALAGVGAAALLIVAGSQQGTYVVPGVDELFRANSNFGLIQVVQTQQAKPLRFLLNDLLWQNIYDPVNHKGAASFSYVEDALIDAYKTEDVHDVLCIGLGAGVEPMRLAKAGVRVDVFEINPVIVKAAEQFFDFDSSKVNMQIGDGRYFLHESTKQYDAIIFDAFLGDAPPSHLMTKEAFQSVGKRLRPNGLAVINSWGEFAPGKDFVPSSLDQTLKSVYRSVRMHDAKGNVFFVVSNRPDLHMLRQPDLSAVPPKMRVDTQKALDALRTADPTHGMVLADNYNPVDYRDAPYREELRRRMVRAAFGN